jgi:DNA-binding MarR family transcriptional regulator
MPSRVEPAVRVPREFEQEFPNGSALATEAFLNIGLLTGGVRNAFEQLIAEAGLPSMAAFNVLTVLAGDAEPLRPSVIAERVMVTRATTTGVLDSLEARGLVSRDAHHADGRSRVIAITRAGRRIIDALVPRVHEFERDLMTVLSDAELRRLIAMVAGLQTRLRELAPDARLAIR